MSKEEEKYNKDFIEGLNKVSGIKTLKDLSEMEDECLAEWQSTLKSNTAQYILCNQEWQRRLMTRQIKTMYWVSVIGIVGILIGTILGANLK